MPLSKLILVPILLTVASATAMAERCYYLVGTRHVYKIGLNRDANVAARMEIEKTFADRVNDDQDTFQKHVDAGADKEKESQQLNAALDQEALDRDKSLGAIFENDDAMREQHPELKIDGDGPYQVMGIEFHQEADVAVFDSMVVYAPWPGFVAVGDVAYGGWVFGVAYAPAVFFDRYHGWHDRYYHGERFFGGMYGHHGLVRFAPRGFHDRGLDRHDDRPGARYGAAAHDRPGDHRYGDGARNKPEELKHDEPKRDEPLHDGPAAHRYGGGASVKADRPEGGDEAKPTHRYGDGAKAKSAEHDAKAERPAPKYGAGALAKGGVRKPVAAASHAPAVHGPTVYKTTKSTYHGTKVAVGATATTKPGGAGGAGAHPGATASNSGSHSSTPASHPSAPAHAAPARRGRG